jgi:hypothetical protein
MHGHDYSAPPVRYNSLPRRSPLTRAAFSNPGSRVSYDSPRTSSLRSIRPLSADCEPQRVKERVSFLEPEPEDQVSTEIMSEDGQSIALSEEGTTISGGRRRRRKSSRASTTYFLAQPAPTLKHKQRLLHIRPQLLLQLQQVSATSRSVPALDVLPSTTLVPRLAKKLPHLFKGKEGLGVNDVLVMKSEDYRCSTNDNENESDSDDEGWARRDVVAVICQMRRNEGGASGKAGIILADGSIWVATPVSNNMFEFQTTDSRGEKTTVRWVRRRGSRNSADLSQTLGSDPEMKFVFSIVDPNTRRHPIIATMTDRTLDIPQHYGSASTPAVKLPSPPSPQLSEEYSNSSTPEEGLAGDQSCQIVDDRLKTLIQVTAVWLALRQGLSSNFRYNDAKAVGPAPLSGHNRVRSTSLNQESPRSMTFDTRASTPDSAYESVTGKIKRTSAHFLHRGSPSSVASTPADHQSSVPRRSVSTGTAFMQRAAARRAGNPPSTVPSDSEGEGQYSRPQRTSMTDLDSNVSNGRASAPSPLGRVDKASPTLILPIAAAKGLNSRRLVQSAYYPSDSNQKTYNVKKIDRSARSSMEMQKSQKLDKKSKTHKWKSFTNLFRRKHEGKH